MAKSRKQTAPWQGVLMGSLVCLGVYLLGLLFLAMLLVKGVLSEGSGFPVVAVLCVLAALCGGLLAVRQSAQQIGGLLAGTAFAAVLLTVVVAFWRDGITWMGHGGILLLCALGGGLLAGLLNGRRGHTGKRKRK